MKAFVEQCLPNSLAHSSTSSNNNSESHFMLRTLWTWRRLSTLIYYSTWPPTVKLRLSSKWLPNPSTTLDSHMVQMPAYLSVSSHGGSQIHTSLESLSSLHCRHMWIVSTIQNLAQHWWAKYSFLNRYHSMSMPCQPLASRILKLIFLLTSFSHTGASPSSSQEKTTSSCPDGPW